MKKDKNYYDYVRDENGKVIILTEEQEALLNNYSRKSGKVFLVNEINKALDEMLKPDPITGIPKYRINQMVKAMAAPWDYWPDYWEDYYKKK